MSAAPRRRLRAGAAGQCRPSEHGYTLALSPPRGDQPRLHRQHDSVVVGVRRQRAVDLVGEPGQAGGVRRTDRSLDAIHLATADPFLAEVTAFVTYDAELAAAATELGFPVAAPT